MTSFFMDTSAIIKRYVAEVGSTWLTALAQPPAGHVIVISRLATVEACSALARLQRLNNWRTVTALAFALISCFIPTPNT